MVLLIGQEIVAFSYQLLNHLVLGVCVMTH